MITLKAKKVESNTLVIERPKERGFMPPPSRVFKDKRRQDKKKNSWRSDWN